MLDTLRFPALAGTTQNEWGTTSFEDEVPPDDLISNVTVVPSRNPRRRIVSIFPFQSSTDSSAMERR